MINSNININSSTETVKGQVELYEGSTLLKACTCSDVLQSFTVERVEESGKFFGFGVCQKSNINLIDLERTLNITTANHFMNYLGVDEEFISPFPKFYVTEVNRDETTNSLSITAYDILYKAAEHTLSELGLTDYTIRDLAQACAAIIGATGLVIEGIGQSETCFDTYYETGGNTDGTETIRDILNAIAEVTQTIYYINYEEKLVFKRLDKDGEPVLTLEKEDYYTLDSKTNRRLTNVCHATELGDNVDGGLRGAASGEAVRLDNVAPEAQDIKINIASKNIFDINKSLLGDLTNLSIWAGVLLETAEVQAMFKPNTKYTAQFVAECIEAIGGFTSIFDAHLGFMLHNPVTKQSVSVCGLYRSNTTTVLRLGDIVEASNTFTTPESLDGYKLLAYTQRCLDGEAPVLNTIKFSNIQIEEGEQKTAYTPYVADLTQVAVTKCSKNLAPKLEKTAINQGVTFEPVENGGIAVSGMPSGVSVCTLATIKPIVTTGKVTFSLTGDYVNLVPDFKILNSAGHSIAQFQTGKTQVIDLDLYPDAATWIIAIKREANSVAVSGTVYVQLELGDKATEYEPYSSQIYAPEANGTVSGVSAVYPTTTLYTDAATLIKAEYYQENSISGTTQYIRNNPFWDLREDIADLVDNALAAVYKLTINQFETNWTGNFLLEIGDKIAITTEDDNLVYSYILNDFIDFTGFFDETTSWEYLDNEGETASNPSTLGEALNQTSAKVDKVNKEIELLASKNNTNEEAIASIRLDTENITSTVQKIDKTTQESIENLNTVTNNLSTELHQTATDIEISIQELREMEIDSVTTTTGFTFNQDGLTVTKSDSEIKTQITENGMTVYKDNQEVLVANNKGVQAIDLNASTYLIIGKNSRFEDYVSNRTGCFWIGG